MPPSPHPMSSPPQCSKPGFETRLLLGLVLGCALGLGCGGAEARSAGASSPNETSAPADKAPPGNPTDTLADFRRKLASGLGSSTELNLAAKGFGPGT